MDQLSINSGLTIHALFKKQWINHPLTIQKTVDSLSIHVLMDCRHAQHLLDDASWAARPTTCRGQQHAAQTSQRSPPGGGTAGGYRY